MARSGPWMLFSGMVATAAGLAIVLGHNVWSGGALAIAVTLFGWAALLKGGVAAPGSAGTDGRCLQGSGLRAILLHLDGRRAGVWRVDHAGRVRKLKGDNGAVRRIKAARYCSHSLANAANRHHRREGRDDRRERSYPVWIPDRRDPSRVVHAIAGMSVATNGGDQALVASPKPRNRVQPIALHRNRHSRSG